MLILSNHQTDYDPILVGSHFNRPIYYVTTDTILNGFSGAFIRYTVNPIPKRKGAADVRTVAAMLQVAEQGGSICVFLEGNRTYAEFQFPIGDSVVRFLRRAKMDIALFNFHGGTGTHPRWGKKPRKGKFYGEIREIIPHETYKDYDDETLVKRIREGLRVYDSESGELYKSNAKAEYLEKFLFVCPKCGKKDHLRSEGDHIRCTECELDATYGEDLHFTSSDPAFSFSNLNDWYQYSKEWVRDYEPEDIIFEDRGTLYQYANGKKEPIHVGAIHLNKTALVCGEHMFPIHRLLTASPVSGGKLNFTNDEGEFLFVGHERFNPVKYVLMFHRLSPEFDLRDEMFRLE